MRDVERRQIVANHRHHRVDCPLARHREPLLLGFAPECAAELLRQSLADRLQVISGIETFGNRPDVLSERLAVAKEG